MDRLTIAIAGALAAAMAAPVAQANCDTELEQLSQRIAATDMDPQNRKQLTDWLEQQKQEHATASAPECTALAAEIQRQMGNKGYLYAAPADAAAAVPRGSGARAGAASAPPASAGAKATTGNATPAGVAVRQPPAQVDVQQQAAEVDVAMQPAEVTVRVPDPQVRVVQPPPQVTVQQPDPKVTVQQQEPVVSVQQSEPRVRVSQGEPQVEVEQGEPQVLVQSEPAEVNVERGEASVVNRQANGATVRVGNSLDPRGSALVGSEPGAPAGGADNEWGNAAATAQGEVAASALVGLSVKDDAGQSLGEITEALKQPEDDAVFVRIAVDPASGVQDDPLLVPVAELERRDGELKLRNAQASAQPADVPVDSLEPAGDVTVQLAGEW